MTLSLDLIDGFAASVPASSIHRLSDSEYLVEVSSDGPIRLGGWDTGAPNSGGALHRITTKVVGADAMWRLGHTGQGVGVALIDSGVVPVEGLDGNGKILDGPDISFDSDVDALMHLDSYGHGTHMAGIIAGSDNGLPDRPEQKDVARRFAGVAPGAHIVNVKVADGSGTADVSQVIAGIQWVVAHKDDPEANIGVLNLSFGTDSVQDHLIDPLAHAAEAAWHAGIVVVTAAGNDGFEDRLRNPAIDPFVIAVGAADANGTYGTGDDELLSFSNCGTSSRPVDVVAPGQSVESLRVPGSFADTFFPEAATGERFFRGTGTSQSAAVVSGAAALVLSQHPDLTPDQVKALLVASARDNRIEESCGDRMLDLHSLSRMAVPEDVSQDFEPSNGSGSLDAARGSFRVFLDGEPLTGEVDFTGRSWSGGTWSGRSWSGGTWSGRSWSGGTWSGGTWSGRSWSGGTWSGGTWSGQMWQGLRWG